MSSSFWDHAAPLSYSYRIVAQKYIKRSVLVQGIITLYSRPEARGPGHARAYCRPKQRGPPLCSPEPKHIIKALTTTIILNALGTAQGPGTHAVGSGTRTLPPK
jgi:hypothetical protein